jgi:hypothetical protein
MCRSAAVAVLLLAVGRAAGAAVSESHAMQAGPQRLRGGFEAALALKPANLGTPNPWSGQNVGESAAPAAAMRMAGLVFSPPRCPAWRRDRAKSWGDDKVQRKSGAKWGRIERVLNVRMTCRLYGCHLLSKPDARPRAAPVFFQLLTSPP